MQNGQIAYKMSARKALRIASFPVRRDGRASALVWRVCNRLIMSGRKSYSTLHAQKRCVSGLGAARWMARCSALHLQTRRAAFANATRRIFRCGVTSPQSLAFHAEKIGASHFVFQKAGKSEQKCTDKKKATSRSRRQNVTGGMLVCRASCSRLNEDAHGRQCNDGPMLRLTPLLRDADWII